MIHKIVTVQEPKLRQATKRVEKLDKKVLKIIEDMQETLKVQKDPEGVGLAAPQIRVPLKIFIMQHKDQNTIIINPEIIKISKKTNDPQGRNKSEIPPKSGHPPKSENTPKTTEKPQYVMEGCLSLPHYYGPVQRSWEVILKYDSPVLENGEWRLENRQEKFIAFPAQIIQHEVDHLNGKIFVDRLLEQKRQLFKLENKEWHEVELP